MIPGGAGPLDRGALLLARAAIFGALASPVLVLEGAYFPYTVARAAAFDRCADLALIAWLFLLARGAIVPRATPTTLLVLGFVGWILVTALAGVHPERSFAGTLERGEGVPSWVRAALLLLVADGVFVGATQRRTLLAGATVAAIAVLMAAIVAMPDASKWLQGAFGNSGLLAGYLLGALALPLVLAGDRAAGSALRITAGIAACALLFGLGLTGNRAAAFALASGIAAAGATRLRHRGFAIGAILLVVAVLAMLLVADDPRGTAWRAAFLAIGERPLLGWGVENFNLPFDRHRVGAEAEAFFDRAHNAILDWAVAGGLVAAALHLAPLLRGLASTGDAAAVTSIASPAAMRTGAIVAKLAFGAFWFDQPLTLLLVGLLLATGEEAGTLRQAPRADAWRVPLAIASIGSTMLAWQTIDVLQRSREIGAAHSRVAPYGVLTALPAARDLPYAVRQDLRLLTAQLLLDSIQAEARPPTSDELRAAIEALEDFAREAPLDCRAPLLASILLEAARMPDPAAEARARARVLSPSHPAILRHDRLAARH